MKCKECGIEIKKCCYGNSDCDVVGHYLCNKCDNSVGLGCQDPCWKFKINDDLPMHQINIKCLCGNKSNIDTEFEINIIGMLEFKCKKCGKIQDTGGSIRNKDANSGEGE